MESTVWDVDFSGELSHFPTNKHIREKLQKIRVHLDWDK